MEEKTQNRKYCRIWMLVFQGIGEQLLDVLLRCGSTPFFLNCQSGPQRTNRPHPITLSMHESVGESLVACLAEAPEERELRGSIRITMQRLLLRNSRFWPRKLTDCTGEGLIKWFIFKLCTFNCWCGGWSWIHVPRWGNKFRQIWIQTWLADTRVNEGTQDFNLHPPLTSPPSSWN